MSSITLVIPAFNEKGNIRPFYESCSQAEKGSNHSFSYVYIDDGSSDGTFDEVKALAEKHPESAIKGIKFSRNFGKEAGILAGLRQVDGDYAVIIDADLQQNPKYVVEMADFLDKNPDYDCVACYQEDRKENGFMKFMKKSFYKIMDNSSDTAFVEDVSDFRLMRREMVDAVLQLGEYHRFSKGIFSWVGFNTYYMPYTVEERFSGNTSWNLKSLTKYAFEGIFGFSSKPLRFATWIGSITSAVALIFLLYNVIKTLAFGKDVPGYTTIVCLILIVGGIQMVLLGIMGEYISRIFIETKHRPIYIVKETVGTSEEWAAKRSAANADNTFKRDSSKNESSDDNQEGQPANEDNVFRWEKI